MVSPNRHANCLPKLKIAFVLPGLGRVQRGAEMAFVQLATELSRFPDLDVTLFGSGEDLPSQLSSHVTPCVHRERFERFPKLPVLRSEYCYEELSFILNLIMRRSFRAADYHAVVHCTFPFTNWFVQRFKTQKLKSIFVTQNGDWMCRADSREYRTFNCDGLICTNPEYFERHEKTYHSSLIPNGVNPTEFAATTFQKPQRDPRIPPGKPIVFMSSALIPSKRVLDGVRSVGLVPDAFLVIAGDGPEREKVQQLAARELPGRHLILGSVPRVQMPALYQQADAFLHMSQDEPFGIVYLEAAASGLPIVAHSGTVPQWILGSTALYANTSDPLAVSAMLKTALQPNAKATLGEKARERVIRDWTWTSQAEKYRDFIYSVVTKNSRKEEPCARSSS